MKLKRFGTPGTFIFKCPGCKDNHVVSTQDASSGYKWGFNGSLDKPTFTPSLLIRSGHYVDPSGCWCKYNRENPGEKFTPTCYICHSFVVDGKIRFLPDCTHELAGQTVELPDVLENEK